ncbi:hypothetical protein CC1G_08697 [Coprinopsis cinerea okayama7|uniref:Uncharacterized protein n=1 Tax=Coprinopsis cinerea (strain Okayama-7 / 130 / ATCC MYA-4618 / FGSC 9003) TaxID=240176 RepID=A8NZH9_COPC7|nr:hypothetical protein CC1G_08697 [Coprinopsis cinerea okayama7\|eukprot:XP_001837684.1 hypothetical protein CC1G_08697 [Coprinopsis cinerea okayama7\
MSSSKSPHRAADPIIGKDTRRPALSEITNSERAAQTTPVDIKAEEPAAQDADTPPSTEAEAHGPKGENRPRLTIRIPPSATTTKVESGAATPTGDKTLIASDDEKTVPEGKTRPALVIRIPPLKDVAAAGKKGNEKPLTITIPPLRRVSKASSTTERNLKRSRSHVPDVVPDTRLPTIIIPSNNQDPSRETKRRKFSSILADNRGTEPLSAGGTSDPDDTGEESDEPEIEPATAQEGDEKESGQEAEVNDAGKNEGDVEDEE